jgi:hypothetical protein
MGTALPVADQRVLAGVAATINVSLVDQDGVAAAAVGTITVTITRADGTVIATGRSTSAGTGTGAFTAALTATETASLDTLTCSWLDGGVARLTTVVEVVGGYWFSVADARSAEGSLQDTSKYPTAAIVAVRRYVEDEFERIMGVAGVPRYRRLSIRGSNRSDLVLPDVAIRALREVTIYDGTTFSVSERAALIQRDEGVLTMVGSNWPTWDVTVGYEHGLDRPPGNGKAMAIRRARRLLNQARSPLPDDVQSMRFVMQDGQTIGLNTAGKWRTGDDVIDSYLASFGRRTPGVG